RYQGTTPGCNLRRFIVVRPVTDIFDSGCGKMVRRVERLRETGSRPSHRPFPGEILDCVKRSFDHRRLILLLMKGNLLEAVPHELPTGVLTSLCHARIFE